jgi:hypothetical protein
MTCGTHEAAASSTFPRQQGIERKKEIAKNQRVKIIQEKKLLFYIEDDMWVLFCSSGLNVSNTA